MFIDLLKKALVGGVVLAASGKFAQLLDKGIDKVADSLKNNNSTTTKPGTQPQPKPVTGDAD